VVQSQPEWIILHGSDVTAVIECCKNEAPLWRYWGMRLPDGVTPGSILRESRPEPSFSPHFDQPLTIFPGGGVGWFGAAALLAHRAGADWSFQATRCDVEQNVGSAVIKLYDDVAKIELVVSLSIKGNVLKLSTSLTNRDDGVLDVAWLASGVLPLPADAHTVLSYSGRHNSEFVAVTNSLTRSMWRRENRRGLTSHDCFPGAIVEADGATFGAQLGWSGNHAQQIEWIDDGRYQWQMGEAFAPGEVRLAAGETIRTADMLATCGVDASIVAQNFHAAIRARMNWPGDKMRPRPVHLNTWEGFYFSHDEAALMELADAAAAVGIERFVLDDGWFAGRDNDLSSLGDWWADSRKYPNGLAPLASHVVSLGMEFGLWVEPEMVNPDSELYRNHPDWALSVDGRPLLASRNQLVLDMQRADVQEYLFEKIAALLRELPISYLKWDHNRDVVAAGNRPAYRAQVHGGYALMSRLRAGFPNVEIEACAGGGGRIDAGVVQHCHRFWTSDNIDAVSRVAIQRGFLQFMPPETMGAHIGASPAHATGRSQSMAFRGGVALPGHFGVELDVRKLNDVDRAELAGWISTYKQHRDRLHHGQVWMGEGSDGLLWQAHGTPHDVLLLIYRIDPQTQRHAPSLKLPMLDAGVRYRLTDAPFGLDQADGAWLIQHGLALRPMKAESVQIIRLTKI
jgi:alpha-galactosidase